MATVSDLIPRSKLSLAVGWDGLSNLPLQFRRVLGRYYLVVHVSNKRSFAGEPPILGRSGSRGLGRWCSDDDDGIGVRPLWYRAAAEF
jgi:hypothetical protein